MGTFRKIDLGELHEEKTVWLRLVQLAVSNDRGS